MLGEAPAVGWSNRAIHHFSNQSLYMIDDQKNLESWTQTRPDA